MVDYAVKNDVKNIICGGDVFDSRTFQRLSHLKCWERCLELFRLNNITCYCNTGNHDKSLYNSKDNFIEPFKYHPALKLFSELTDIELNGKNVTFSPFFTDSMLENQLTNHVGSDVLIGHWSCDGSTYLGKTDKNKSLNKKLLSKWSKVFLSHYHNYHEVTKNIIHLPSLIQDNYGEDNMKGFSVIYDDLSYKVIKGDFKEFRKIVINLDTTTLEEIKDFIKTDKNSSNKIRYEITGEETKLKSFDKSIFNGTGIDVKMKYDKKYDFNKPRKLPKVNEIYGEEDVRVQFKVFCKDKGYDFKFGKTLLDKFFKKK